MATQTFAVVTPSDMGTSVALGAKVAGKYDVKLATDGLLKHTDSGLSVDTTALNKKLERDLTITNATGDTILGYAFTTQA